MQAPRTSQVPTAPLPHGVLDRKARLFRWAELLERDPDRHVALLPPLWTIRREARDALNTSRSALEVAYHDPVFRVAGLHGASVADAQAFFGLNEREFDRITASSRWIYERPAWQIAVRIRNIADPRVENRLFVSMLLVAFLLAAIIIVMR